jgi:hypothetical protein
MSTYEPLPKWSDDPKEYARAWARRKRRIDPVFARQQSDSARRWQLANPVRNARNQYQQGARRRGLTWELSAEAFEALVAEDCSYCGAAPPPDGINGVDRVDSRAGYTEDNVVTACALCNYAKRDQPVEAFIAWAKRIANHQED